MSNIIRINKTTAAFTLIFALWFCHPVFSQVKNKDQKASAKNLVPVVLIHGIGGSDLRQPPKMQTSPDQPKGLFTDGGFPNDVLLSRFGDPQKLQFTEDGKPREDTLSKTVVAVGFYDVPGRNITDLSKYLQSQGYRLNKNLFEFFYDFRFSVMETAKKLDNFVSRIKEQSGSDRIDIVGHSMGGMIAKAYLADKSNWTNVRNLIFVGTPHLGAPKALKALRYGDNLDVAIIDGCKLKRVAHNMPSMFNLLPGKKYFIASGGGYFYDDDDLDGDGVRDLLDYGKTLYNLQNGKETKCSLRENIDALPLSKLSSKLIQQHTVEFHDALDDWKKPEGVKVFNIVGYGVNTLKSLRENGGKLSVNYTTEGDGTVPLLSAEAVQSDFIYYTNLEKLKTDHSQMIGDKIIIKQILELLLKGEGIYSTEITTLRPAKTEFRTKADINVKTN